MQTKAKKQGLSSKPWPSLISIFEPSESNVITVKSFIPNAKGSSMHEHLPIRSVLSVKGFNEFVQLAQKDDNSNPVWMHEQWKSLLSVPLVTKNLTVVVFL